MNIVYLFCVSPIERDVTVYFCHCVCILTIVTFSHFTGMLTLPRDSSRCCKASEIILVTVPYHGNHSLTPPPPLSGSVPMSIINTGQCV